MCAIVRGRFDQLQYSLEQIYVFSDHRKAYLLVVLYKAIREGQIISIYRIYRNSS